MKALKNMSRKERKLYREKLCIVPPPAKVITIARPSIAFDLMEFAEEPLSDMEKAKAVFDRFPKEAWPLQYY